MESTLDYSSWPHFLWAIIISTQLRRIYYSLTEVTFLSNCFSSIICDKKHARSVLKLQKFVYFCLALVCRYSDIKQTS